MVPELEDVLCEKKHEAGLELDEVLLKLPWPPGPSPRLPAFVDSGLWC